MTIPADRVALEAFLSLEQYMRDSDYSGPDPYDGLLSPFSKAASSKILRQLLIQGNKRSPFELRGFLKIPPVQMSKTLGLVLSSYSLVSELLPETAERIPAIRERLLDKRNQDCAWGYEFDVQMRWGRYPSGSSNIIATSFSVNGLLDSEVEQDDTWKQEVSGWIVSSLSTNGYITYAPSSDRLIHNANLLGALTLLQCHGPHALVESALTRTIQAQDEDGSFPYGDEARTSWIDSFHTAYVLLALHELSSSYPSAVPALERGLKFWLDRCFTPEGRVKYYANDTAETDDVHTNATVLLTLCKLAEMPEAADRLHSFKDHYLSRLGSDGFVSNRKHATPYMRWELAHQLRALAELLRLESA